MNWSSLNNAPLRRNDKPTAAQQLIIIDRIKQYCRESETEFTSFEIQKHLLKIRNYLLFKDNYDDYRWFESHF